MYMKNVGSDFLIC